MRILLDLQNAQESYFRGIGRWSVSFARAVIAQSKHDFWILLNTDLVDAMEIYRTEFADLIPYERFLYFRSINPVNGGAPANDDRRELTSILWRQLVSTVKPDLVWASGGFSSLTVPPVADPRWKLAITFYDLIPLLSPETHLKNKSLQRAYSFGLECCKTADLLLGISNSSCQEALDHLQIPSHKVVPVSSATTNFFHVVGDQKIITATIQRFCVTRPFVLFTGGDNPNKNKEGLVEAYGNLPKEIRQNYQLIIVCDLREETRLSLQNLTRDLGMDVDELVLPGRVSDTELLHFYNACALFVCPSWHEGFGLPVLEAMQCDAPVISSNRTSLPEIVQWEEAMFNPSDLSDFVAKLMRGLTDETFRARLKLNARKQRAKFSWENTARLALSAFEKLAPPQISANKSRLEAPQNRLRLALVTSLISETPNMPAFIEELTSDLSVNYEVEVFTVQREIADPRTEWSLKLRSSKEFISLAPKFDLIIYHFADCGFHGPLVALLRLHPGIVILPNVSFPNESNYSESNSDDGEKWLQNVWRTQGWTAFTLGLDNESLRREFSFDGSIFEAATHIIVQSEKDRMLAEKLCGPAFASRLHIISSEKNYRKTIEDIYQTGELSFLHNAVNQTRDYLYRKGLLENDALLRQCSASIARVNSQFSGKSRLLCDISELRLVNFGTGIQRVVNHIVECCVKQPWKPMRTEIVATSGNALFYPNQYSAKRWISQNQVWSAESLIPSPNDIYLRLEILGSIEAEHFWTNELHMLKATYFCIYDLLPIRHSQWFGDALQMRFKLWLKSLISVVDGLVCISKTVADDLHAYLLEENFPRRRTRPLQIGYFHLGSDFKQPDPHTTTAVPELGISKVDSVGTFLMVSTIEPRKGYAQALAAFEILWEKGVQVNLAIVGKRGWNVASLLEKLDSHPEKKKRLHWFEAAPDEVLTECYHQADCILVASEGEGFGLSLIEAAHHGKPILCRDLPIFQEVAGEYAAYFTGLDPQNLADAVELWLTNAAVGKTVSTKGMPHLTWEQSAEQLREVIQGGNWLHEWSPSS